MLDSSALSFPSDPVVGQTHDFGGKTFYCGVAADGTKVWRQITPALQQQLNALWEPPEQWFSLAADFTLLVQTGVQDIFPVRLSLRSNRTYWFEAVVLMTGLSTAGTYSWSFAGGATITRTFYYCQAGKSPTATAQTSAPVISVVQTAAATVISANNANTVGIVYANGKLVIGSGGTVSPQISFSSATGLAGIVKQDSFYRMMPIGADTQVSSET